MTLRIVQQGLLTTIQDMGRRGAQHLGVPVSGAMDPLALRVANLLVGNDEEAAGIEMTIIGAGITFEDDALVALGGADLQAMLDGVPVPAWHAAFASRGATLTFRGAATGCHTALAVAGGLDVPRVLGSRSTSPRASLGGLEGRPLRGGDMVPVCADRSDTSQRLMAALQRSADRGTPVARWGLTANVREWYRPGQSIRVVEGSHTALLDDGSRERFYSQAFRVSTQSDRMGYRLTGVPLSLTRPLELLSEGVTTGTIQLPPGGDPIVLLADRQTIGGYPRIAHVASVDLPALAQRRPGEAVRFMPWTVEDAREAKRTREAELAHLASAIGALSQQA